MEELKKWEDLTITDDFMFCKVMSDSALCKELLEMWFWLADTVSMEHANEIFLSRRTAPPQALQCSQHS